jgi:DNA-binding transcriptional MerR regulator
MNEKEHRGHGMEKISDLMEKLKLDTHLTVEDIPNIDLYMDQVIQLFEKTYKDSKRNDNEKVLTKTMINNYAKGKLFFPITNKKYSKDHLLLISLIYQLKGALSINDIKSVLDGINQKVLDEEIDLDQFYQSYLQMTKKNAERFRADVKESMKAVEEEIENLTDSDSTYLEEVLLVSSLVNMSNFYRRAAEQLVDQIATSKDKKVNKNEKPRT